MDSFRQWEKCLLVTSDVTWKSCPLQVKDFTVLCTEIEKNGGYPQGMWNICFLVGPFVDRPHVGVGT